MAEDITQQVSQILGESLHGVSGVAIDQLMPFASETAPEILRYADLARQGDPMAERVLDHLIGQSKASAALVGIEIEAQSDHLRQQAHDLLREQAANGVSMLARLLSKFTLGF